MSPGLKRAREPYKVKNAITGIAITAFIVGAWAYSISAVKQDSFDDVDEEARALVGSGARSLEDEERARKAEMAKLAATGANTSTARASGLSAPVAAPSPSSQAPAAARGVLVGVLETRYPRLLDPTRKTLVWGAPSVDRIGRIGDRSQFSS
ncbi:hypothetical protein EWM64_g9305 [Hericium alpestre]|uniref:Cytochrome c oxidase assembly factor 3 n=1 Tax=Hericium alpestre TaxID=135208 RepID=A0A4Y9ZMG1_9AGAM|nr:hypothetical protein EWM64_g9305 [Hericium alpestre]